MIKWDGRVRPNVPVRTNDTNDLCNASVDSFCYYETSYNMNKMRSAAHSHENLVPSDLGARSRHNARATNSQRKMSDNAVWNAVKPYMNGGLSGMGATCVIQPLDSTSSSVSR